MKINKSGVWGEIFAARYLRDNGYKIITGNFRSRMGEIDLVAQKGKYMCFVEVKTRTEGGMFPPADAVDREKRKRLVKAILADERAVPLTTPVDWSQYDENISVVYMNGIEPEGVLLFERQENDLIFSCAWAVEPRELVSMLVSALTQAEQLLPADAVVLIPVIDRRVAELVEKLVPVASCRKINEWSLGFRI